MSKKKKFILILLIFTNFYSNSYAQNLAYIDLDTVLEQSKLGLKIHEKLKKDRETKLNEIKLKETKLKELDQNIDEKKNILSKQELENEFSKLQSELRKLNILKDELKKEYDENKNREIMEFFNKINPYIQKYLSDHSIDILFNNKNIVIGKDNLDITSKIITIIDNEIN